MGKGILSIIIIFCLNFVLCLLAFTLTFILPRVDEKERKHNKKGQEEKQEEKQENKKRSKDKREHSREGAKRTSLLFCLVVFTHKILREQQPITSTIYQTCTCMTRETWIKRREKRAEMHVFMVSWGIWERENNVIMQYHAMQRRRMLCNEKKEEIKKKRIGSKNIKTRHEEKENHEDITSRRNETVNSIEQKPRERSRWQRWHEFEFKSRAIKEDHPLLPSLKQTFLKMEKHSRKRLERNFSRITKSRQTEKEIKDRQLPTHFYTEN